MNQLSLDLGEPTHTHSFLVGCLNPLPPRNQCAGWFAPPLSLKHNQLKFKTLEKLVIVLEGFVEYDSNLLRKIETSQSVTG
jgi:hypothetical protein